MRAPMARTVRESIRYGFAVGKARVLETRVFGSDVYERLLDAPSFDEQKRILSDTPFGRVLEGATTVEDVERGLELALEDFYGFLEEARLPDEVIRFFRVRYDYANVKALLKAETTGAPLASLLVAHGTVDRDRFLGPVDELPDFLADTYRGASGAEEGRGRDAEAAPFPGSRETEVDAAMYRDLAQTARRSRSEFLKGLAALMIDVADARAVVRARLAGRPHAELSRILLDGGSIKPKEFEDLYTLPATELGARLGQVPALSGLSPSDAADLQRLDVIADNVVIAYVRKSRVVPFGPEPVIGYVMAREAQVITLRVVLIGKITGVGAEELRARLREL